MVEGEICAYIPVKGSFGFLGTFSEKHINIPMAIWIIYSQSGTLLIAVARDKITMSTYSTFQAFDLFSGYCNCFSAWKFWSHSMNIWKHQAIHLLSESLQKEANFQLCWNLFVLLTFEVLWGGGCLSQPGVGIDLWLVLCLVVLLVFFTYIWSLLCLWSLSFDSCFNRGIPSHKFFLSTFSGESLNHCSYVQYSCYIFSTIFNYNDAACIHCNIYHNCYLFCAFVY